MHRNLLPLLLLLLLAVVALDACPTDMCVCKWKNGKQTAECSNRQLGDLPSGLDVGTQVLNFTGNRLTALKAEWFYHLNLINLQKIFLMRNEIARIHSRAFHGLSNLVELDLSDNQLTTVPSDSFADYGSLMRLALNGNPIRVLRSAAFKHLPFLTSLELTNCQIEVVESEAFIGMDNLEWLRLDGNRIATIRGAHLLPDSLHGISLQGNRWNCDCTMVDLHRWLSTSTVPQTEEPKCVQPTRLAGSTIKSVDRGQLACAPEITPASLSLEIAENRNLTLTCKVAAQPAATISWWFQGRALENHTIIGTNIHLLMTFTMEQGEQERRIDLFISNTTADTNGTFVCTAENAAGRVQANYTVRVISKEEPVVEQVKFPYEYYLMFIAGAAGMAIIVLIIVCIVIVKCCCQRRGRANRRRGENNGGVDGVNGHWKKTHFGNVGDGQPNGQTGGGGSVGGVGGGPGNVTLITDKVMGGGQAAIIGTEHQLNGGLCYGSKQDVIMYVSSGLVGGNGESRQDAGDLMQQQQQQHRVATVSSSAAAVAGVTTSPPHLMGRNNYSPDPINPDLINDTEKQRLAAISSSGGGGAGSGSLSSSNIKSASQTNIPLLYCNNSNNNNNGANLLGDDGKLREFVSQSYTRPGMQQQQHLGTLPRTRILSADHHQMQLLPHHHHQADVHLNPGCFLAPQQQQQPGGVELPVEYSLTNVMAVLPTNAAAAQQTRQLGEQQQQQSVNFAYRTLPHRMKIRNGPSDSTSLNAGATIRFSRDAEFLTALPPPQPNNSFDMYAPANVRYTAEGYPYTPAQVGSMLAAAAAATGGTMQTTIATTQQVVAAFQDPSLQFLPSPPEGYKMENGGEVNEAGGGGGGVVNQHWPPCLPGYNHPQQQQQQTASVPTSQIVPIKTNFAQRFASPLASPASSVTSSTSSSKMSTSTNATSTASTGNNGNATAPAGVGNQLPLHTPPPPVITKRCVAAQTMLMGSGGGTDVRQEEPPPVRRIGLLATASTLNDVDETEEEEECEEVDAKKRGSQQQQRGTSCRHLNGPLADSPDEGYVGDSGHDGNGSSD